MTMIKSYEVSENCHAYTVEVHALKSASKQIGALDLSEKARELEKAGNEGNLEFIHNNTDEMLSKYGEYMEILAPYFIVSNQDDSDKQMITNDLLKKLFKKLRQAIDDLDMDDMEEVLKELKQYRYEGKAKTLLEHMQESIDNVDIESLEEVIENWEALIY